MRSLAESWLKARGSRHRVLNIPLPIQPFRAFSKLETVQGDSGGETWAEWLAGSSGHADSLL